jgi:hypothetical protein
MLMHLRMVSDSEDLSLDLDATGAIDNENGILWMVAEIPAEPGVSAGPPAESYLDGNVMYTRMVVPGIPDLWTREEFGEGYWEAQNFFLVQLRLLKACGVVTGTEEVDGVNCFVVDMECSRDELTDVMLAQAGFQDLAAGGLDMSDAIEKASARFWYAEATLLPLKGELDMRITFDVGVLDTTMTGSSPVTLDAETDIGFHGYNEIESLALPDEAKNAVDSSQLEGE